MRVCGGGAWHRLYACRLNERCIWSDNTYIITTSRITSGEEWKYRNGLSDFGLLITVEYHRSALAASIPLTMPGSAMNLLCSQFVRFDGHPFEQF
jgi:hypothetical protein